MATARDRPSRAPFAEGHTAGPSFARAAASSPAGGLLFLRETPAGAGGACDLCLPHPFKFRLIWIAKTGSRYGQRTPLADLGAVGYTPASFHSVYGSWCRP